MASMETGLHSKSLGLAKLLTNSTCDNFKLAR